MKVRGTQTRVKTIEVNKDTVYVRTNITEVNEDDFIGWEYDEEQYPINNYIENLSSLNDTQSIAMLVSILMGEVDTLRNKIEKLEGGN